MDIIWQPEEIERRSMEIIEPYLEGTSYTPGQKAVVKRIIHTTGDPGIIGDIIFHPAAVREGMAALQRGASVFTDVNMLKAGINKKILAHYGGEVHCYIGDAEVESEAKKAGITRAAAGFRLYAGKMDRNIIAIGNAPTALFETIELCRRQRMAPALIVGTPVGFVGAAESKELLARMEQIPYITVQGTRGGSSIAASIINALLYHEGEE